MMSKKRVGWRLVQGGCVSVILLTLSLLVACSSGDDENASSSSTSSGSSSGTSTSSSSGSSSGTSGKLDLLLMIDNSRSMRDKQEVLEATVPFLIDAFTTPSGGFAPVQDIHIGVITSSLGGHGADACAAITIPSENDLGHLIYRTDGGGSVDTYLDLGFLAWASGDTASTNLYDLSQIIVGAGEVGCGFEAQLESWYRFLIDPDPYESIQLVGDNAVLVGTDGVILQQREDFLRPDSVVVILMLTDENDCSSREGGQYYYSSQIYTPGTATPYHLPKPQITCATDPKSDCCRSCGESAGDGCPAKGDECDGTLSYLDDQLNMRCYDQKRRFGIDFLYPLDRYLAGLTENEVQDRNGNVEQNPLFEGEGRDPSMVYLAGLVGVPWQAIARRDADDQPDLSAGLQLSAEYEQNGTWDAILGDPGDYVDPTDPHMVETWNARSGLPGPGSATMADPIHGHEYTISQQNDLQYACIFPLSIPRDCSSSTDGTCDCSDGSNDTPICQNPSDSSYGTTQYYAKAYPGLRHLQLLKWLERRGVVGSICPAHMTDSSLVDYGYRPLVNALAETVASSLLPAQ